MVTVHVIPAYGRDYKSKKEVEKAWAEGKDFLIQDMYSPWDGSYINRADAIAGGVRSVQVRYGNLRKVCVIKVGE